MGDACFKLILTDESINKIAEVVFSETFRVE